jgi:hypothetical protein
LWHSLNPRSSSISFGRMILILPFVDFQISTK